MKWRSILAVGFCSSAFAQTLSLKTFLSRVEDQNGFTQSTKLKSKAIPLSQEAGDLELSPHLTLGASALDDQKDTAIPAFQGTRTRLNSATVGLAKKFSTGTVLSTEIAQSRTDVSGTTPAAAANHSTAAGISVSQSLWQDFFGRSTRLRRSREDLSTRIALYAEEVKARRLLIDAEAAYWTLALKANEASFRQGALQRAERISKWQSSRRSNGLANPSDLLQATALLNTRQLQFEQCQDELNAALATVADFANISNASELQPAADELLIVRSLAPLGPNALRFDALLSSLEANLQQNVSDETTEKLKPQLNFDFKYTSNGYDKTLGSAWSETGQVNKPTLYGGLRLQMPLDFLASSRVSQAARIEAEAAQKRAEQMLRQSKTSWIELQRRYNELGRRIQTLTQLVKVQKEKSEVENTRLTNGRSTTFQVVQFEQDYADAQMALLQMHAEARKLESQSQLFEKVMNQ